MTPTLLIAGHGTRSDRGVQTLRDLAALVTSMRASLRVELCFLDVLQPDLPAALSALPGPVVIVPALLSTGFHVRTDIPTAVGGRPDVAVSRHLGPDPLLSRALADRLGDRGSGPVILIATGSSDPGAREDLLGAAADLSAVLGAPVRGMSLEEAGSALTPDVRVASYLLADGYFADLVLARATSAGVTSVSPPIGAHPAVARLILARYDEGCAALQSAALARR
jgi:sirohydrochlorin ferrochelatase